MRCNTKQQLQAVEVMGRRYRINERELETMKQFRYLTNVTSEDVSKTESQARASQSVATLATLKPTCKDKNNKLPKKLKLLQSLGLRIFLYSCKQSALVGELQRKIQAMEMMRCLRRILCTSYSGHVTNEEVGSIVLKNEKQSIDLLSSVWERKLCLFGHITRRNGPPTVLLRRTLQGGTRRGQ